MNTTMRNDESTVKNNIPYEATSIGDLLKSTRERRGITLKDVARKTKVHVGILNQLENNNITNLPSKTYVKGFVRATALFLDIDPKKALELLEEAYDHLIFENLDLIKLPPITRQESFLLKNLSILKKQKGLLDKISIQKLSVFALVAGVTAVGLINYFNNTISSSKHVVLNQIPLPTSMAVPNAEVAKPVEMDTSQTTQFTGQPMTQAMTQPTTTSLVFPKYLETRNSEGIVVPTNRF